MLAPGFPWSTAFVGNWGRDPLIVRDNQLAAGITVSRNLAYRESLHQFRVALSSAKEKLRSWL